jgi:hypothetical protein
MIAVVARTTSASCSGGWSMMMWNMKIEQLLRSGYASSSIGSAANT